MKAPSGSLFDLPSFRSSFSSPGPFLTSERERLLPIGPSSFPMETKASPPEKSHELTRITPFPGPLPPSFSAFLFQRGERFPPWVLATFQRPFNPLLSVMSNLLAIQESSHYVSGKLSESFPPWSQRKGRTILFHQLKFFFSLPRPLLKDSSFSFLHGLSRI